MLQAQGLTKSFGNNKAVDDVSLSIPKGSCFGLLGPNGAGKTTTISMIIGILPCDAGTVSVGGIDLSKEPFAARMLIGYVPQDLALYEDLSGNDNLRFFGTLYGLDSASLQKSAGRALELVGLQDRASEPVKKFSGGMKRRLNLAVALLHDPDFLVLDEPTVGVDPQSRNAIFESLKGLRENGKTILYTTHYMEEVEKLCDRVAIMDHGKVVAEDNLADLHKLLPAQNSMTVDFESLENSANLAVALEGCKAITHVEVEENRARLTVADIADASTAVIERSRAMGLTITGLSSSKASLEEVFLQLTGRTLRD